MIYQGADNFLAGCNQFITGRTHDPLTVQLLQKTGMSHESASLVNLGAMPSALLGAKLCVNSAKIAASVIVPKAYETCNRSAESSVSRVLLYRRLLSEQIAGGHAYKKHAVEFGFTDKKQLAKHIDTVLENPTLIRLLENSRIGFWHEPTKSFVIRDPFAKDGGTCFIPKLGRKYFLEDIK